MKEKGKANRVTWILLAIITPSLFVIAVLTVILIIMGVDVGAKAKEIGRSIPGISSVIGNEENTADTERASQTEAYWKKKVEDRDRMLRLLEKDVESKESDITELKAELAAAQNHTETTPEGKVAVVSGKSKKKVAALYNEMSSKNASAIISKMKDDDAAAILKELEDEAASGILAKMDPVKAAALTLKLK